MSDRTIVGVETRAGAARGASRRLVGAIASSRDISLISDERKVTSSRMQDAPQRARLAAPPEEAVDFAPDARRP